MNNKSFHAFLSAADSSCEMPAEEASLFPILL